MMGDGDTVNVQAVALRKRERYAGSLHTLPVTSSQAILQ